MLLRIAPLLILLSACVAAEPVVQRQPVSAARAVAIFDQTCMATRPLFAGAETRAASVIAPTEAVSLKVSTLTDGAQLCALRVRSPESTDALRPRLGALREDGRAPGLFAFEGRGRGPVSYLPEPSDGDVKRFQIGLVGR